MSFYRLLHLDTFSFFFFEISLFLSFCGALRVTSITNSVDHTHTHTHTHTAFFWFAYGCGEYALLIDHVRFVSLAEGRMGDSSWVLSAHHTA
jgi:hypothetical protein